MSSALRTEGISSKGRLQVNSAQTIENVCSDRPPGATSEATAHPRRDYFGRSWWSYVRCLPSEIRAIVYHSLLWSISLLPPKIAFRAAMVIGRLKYRLKGTRTRPLRREIATSLGITEAQASEWAARSYGVVFWEDVESYFRQRVDEKSLDELIDIRGLENLQSALEEGKGALLCTGHVRGIFIFIITLHMLGYKLNAIRRSPRGLQGAIARWFNRRITLVDRGMCNFLWMQPDNLRVAVQAASALRRNEIVIVLIDARFPTEPVEARFLDCLMPLPSGHVILAQACAAPMLNFFVRSADGLPRIAEIGKPHYAGNDVQASVQHCIAELENEILNSPADWMWHQERKLWSRQGESQS